jgi:hypothetical protein
MVTLGMVTICPFSLLISRMKKIGLKYYKRVYIRREQELSKLSNRVAL